jgi:hypothetical protein
MKVHIISLAALAASLPPGEARLREADAAGGRMLRPRRLYVCGIRPGISVLRAAGLPPLPATPQSREEWL